MIIVLEITDAELIIRGGKAMDDLERIYATDALVDPQLAAQIVTHEIARFVYLRRRDQCKTRTGSSTE